MPNTEQIVRQLDILRTLVARRYGVTLKELAELYDVTQRTISRDLDDLSEAGFPIYPDRRGNKNYWHLEPYKQMPPLNFPIEEIIALTFIEGMISPLEGPSFKEEFKKTVNRIRTTLPKKAREFLERAGAAYYPHVRRQKSQTSPEIFEIANKAIADKKICRVTYHAFSTGQTKTYPICPLRFLYYHNGLYLLCLLPGKDSLLTLAAERIQDLEISSEAFEIPSGLSVEDKVGQAFGIIFEDPIDVKIRFSASQVPYIRERIWHPSQEIEELDTGDIVLSFQAGGFFEIKSWIMSYGAQAEVLEPENLRTEVVAELEKNMAIYKKR
ncbi:MAG: transcriptional regulator [Candidatus Latescibacteria bacterium]|nr:transcriptional regulator [Candidatus Latescibacterota bacterium]